jgi:hypothetical protein
MDGNPSANRTLARELSALTLVAQIAAYVCCTAAVAAPAYALTVRVNSDRDAIDVRPGDGVCAAAKGVCTLRAAIQETNALAGPDVVILPRGTYRLTIPGPGERAAATGDLNITDDLDLRGAGAQSTIIDGGVCADPEAPSCDGELAPANRDRVLSVINAGRPAKVSISGVTIQNGGGSFVSGGGIYVESDMSLSLLRCRVRENKSRQFGGGVSNAGSLQVAQTTIERNTLPRDTLGGFTASGGGIFNFRNGSIEVWQSTISENEAARGAGIRNAGGFLRIDASTISGNKATSRGGGILNFGTAIIRFSTITGNKANNRPSVSGKESRQGGGIHNEGGRIEIGNSIIARNIDVGTSPDCFSIETVITSFRNNLIGVLNNTCTVRDFVAGGIGLDLVGSDRAPLDPLLGPLGSNGGPTRTHALLVGSPAIDRGSTQVSACAPVDQRIFARPTDGDGDKAARCDIGSFEFRASARR